MSNQSNAKLARDVYAAFNKHEFDAALAHMTDDIRITEYAFGREANGQQEAKAFLANWKAPFPDGEVIVRSQLPSEDGVANQNIYRATHTQPLETPNGVIPPTGRQVEFNFAEVWHIRDGKVVSIDNYLDSATIFQQLGLIS